MVDSWVVAPCNILKVCQPTFRTTQKTIYINIAVKTSNHTVCINGPCFLIQLSDNVRTTVTPMTSYVRALTEIGDRDRT